MIADKLCNGTISHRAEGRCCCDSCGLEFTVDRMGSRCGALKKPEQGKVIPLNVSEDISTHEGKKYLRTIHSAVELEAWVSVDVYAVLVAFNVTCQATGHAIKKLLCAGERGKGDRLVDLIGAKAALNRAIELEQRNNGK